MSSLSDTLAVRPIRPQRAIAPAVVIARFDEQFPMSGGDRRGSSTPEQAWTAGYEVGFEQGMACGRAATEADMAAADRRAASVTIAIAGAAERVAAHLQVQLDRASATLLATAFEVAFAIIGRDLRERPRTGEDALREALALVARHEPCVARLHPSDLELLGGEDGTAPAVRGFGRVDFRIVADPTVDSGDCVIETDTARIEHRLLEALARVREALAATEPDPAASTLGLE